MEAFVYKWTNAKTNEYYIGVHKGHINDGYVGSGKIFKQKYNKYKDDFNREILGLFQTYDEALNYEKIMVTKETLLDDKCLNIVLGGGFGWIPELFTATHRKNISKKMKSIQTKEFKDKIRLLGNVYFNYGKPTDYKKVVETRRKNNSYTGRPGYVCSNEEKKNLSVLAKNRQKIECPHCGKCGPIPQLKQWHFGNCKEIKK
jgi:hypothetical protein